MLSDAPGDGTRVARDTPLRLAPGDDTFRRAIARRKLALVKRDVTVGALPRPLTSLVGRERELAVVAMLLARDDVRLVTLTGPGGVGKTRLAIQAASVQADGYPDGVRFVSLAAVRDPALVIPTIATTLGLRQNAARLPMDDVRAHLRDRRLLLVLDNVEQVIAVGPQLVDILAECPDLKILATSRFPLRVSAEHCFAVPPLPLADGMMRPTEDTLPDAVRLFVERAGASDAGFSLTTENAAQVAGICRRLDGLPLAIELAAARVATMPLPVLAQRLERRLPVLTGGPRDAPDRLRTMRDAIAWSHDLLTPEEQVLFRRLAVFVGGFTLDAAAHLRDERDDPLDVVSSLAEQHLLMPMAGDDAEPRFMMLETIQEFGLECLAASGEEATTRARHADYYLGLARRSDHSWPLPAAEGLPIIARLAADHTNLRAARDWFVNAGDVEAELSLGGSVGSLWILLGHCREGQIWLEQALARMPSARTMGRVRALATLAWVTHRMGDSPRARRIAIEGITLAREMGDPLSVIEGQFVLSTATRDIGDLERSTSLLSTLLADLDALDGQPLWARHAASKALELLAHNALRCGDIDKADVFCQEAFARERDLGYAPGASCAYGSHAVSMAGNVARARGDDVDALRLYQLGLEQAWRFRDISRVARGLANVAGTLARLGQHALAAQLFGAAEALCEATGYSFARECLVLQRALGLPEPWQAAGDSYGGWRQLREGRASRAGDAIPPIRNIAAADAAWAAGRTMPLIDAVAAALAAAPGIAKAAPVPASLSSRELEVLRLVAAGQSNRGIATTLFISERTVENHVQHIFNKLGLDSRSAAAIYAVRNGLT